MSTRVSAFEFPTGGLSIYGAIADPSVTQYYGEYIQSIRISLDVDRVPFAEATMVFQDLPEQFWQNLDPRYFAASTAFRLEHRDLDTDSVVSRLPASSLYAASTAVTFTAMDITTATRDLISGQCTVEAVSQDLRQLEQGRAIPGYIDHGQGNVRDLVGWVLGYAPPSSFPNDFMSASAAAIPAGDRRKVAPGDMNWDLIEPEVSGIGGRLFVDLTGAHLLAFTDDPPRVKPFTPPVISAHDPTADGPPLVELEETITRTGDWADTILVKYDWDDSGGIRHTEYWWNGSPGTEKLRMVSYDRPKPGTNQADEIRDRAIQRGRFVTATCAADFRYVPGYDLVVNLAPGTADVNYGMIRRVEYRINGSGEAEMTLTAQTGQPLA